MKKAFAITTSAILLSGTLAHADYQCQSLPQGSTLSVKVQQYPNRVGTDTEVLLQDGPKKTVYYGALESEDGSLLGKKVVQIYPYYKGDTLTIVSKPKNCGRGICDPQNDKIIKAVLKIGNTETSFYCNETNP